MVLVCASDVSEAQANIAKAWSLLSLLIEEVAAKHGLVGLLHEKPFMGINGSVRRGAPAPKKPAQASTAGRAAAVCGAFARGRESIAWALARRCACEESSCEESGADVSITPRPHGRASTTIFRSERPMASTSSTGRR